MTTTQSNMEILRMAKQVIIQEYVDTRAQAHNKWLVESEHLWRTQRLRLAYPDIPLPPTEKDIVQRAQVMIEFVNQQQQQQGPAAEEPKPAPIPDPAPMPIPPPPPEEEPPPQPPPEETQPQPTTATKSLEEQLIDATVNGRMTSRVLENQSMASRILPSVLKKIEEFRKI